MRNSRHLWAPLSPPTKSLLTWGTKGPRFPSALTCLLLSVCGYLLLCFPLDSLLSGLTLNLSSFLGFPDCLLPAGLLPLMPPLGFCVLQASELGMTSAFYKYILTTMVRTPATPQPLPTMSAPLGVQPQPSPPLLGLRTSLSCIWMVLWRTLQTSWASPCSTPPTPSILSLCAASTCPGGRTVKPAPTQAPR